MLPRLLLALSAVILAAGGLMHAKAYGKAVAAMAATELPPFYANSFKGLWLIDAATLLILAFAFGLLAIRPMLAARPFIILIALVPAATAFFLYRFIGNFLPAHMLATAAATATLAGLLPRS